jgi:hypothetical protein
MHLTKAHVSTLSLLAAALIYFPSMPARAQSSDPNPAVSVVQSSTLEQSGASQAARDALFVNCFLISCASIGAIIAFVVWRSLPPKSKADTKNN